MQGSYVLAEGNYFDNVKQVLASSVQGQAFAVSNSADGQTCNDFLGRSCQVNGFADSGSFNLQDKGFLSDFKGQNIASATPYTEVAAGVLRNAGQGMISSNSTAHKRASIHPIGRRFHGH